MRTVRLTAPDEIAAVVVLRTPEPRKWLRSQPPPSPRQISLWRGGVAGRRA